MALSLFSDVPASISQSLHYGPLGLPSTVVARRSPVTAAGFLPHQFYRNKLWW